MVVDGWKGVVVNNSELFSCSQFFVSITDELEQSIFQYEIIASSIFTLSSARPLFI